MKRQAAVDTGILEALEASRPRRAVEATRAVLNAVPSIFTDSLDSPHSRCRVHGLWKLRRRKRCGHWSIGMGKCEMEMMLSLSPTGILSTVFDPHNLQDFLTVTRS